jgi:hypothetical protein
MRPCHRCGVASYATYCPKCDTFGPHGPIRSAEPEADTRLLVGIFWAFVLLAAFALTMFSLYALVFTIGALGP